MRELAVVLVVVCVVPGVGLAQPAPGLVAVRGCDPSLERALAPLVEVELADLPGDLATEVRRGALRTEIECQGTQAVVRVEHRESDRFFGERVRLESDGAARRLAIAIGELWAAASDSVGRGRPRLEAGPAAQEPEPRLGSSGGSDDLEAPEPEPRLSSSGVTNDHEGPRLSLSGGGDGTSAAEPAGTESGLTPELTEVSPLLWLRVLAAAGLSGDVLTPWGGAALGIELAPIELLRVWLEVAIAGTRVDLQGGSVIGVHPSGAGAVLAGGELGSVHLHAGAFFRAGAAVWSGEARVVELTATSSAMPYIALGTASRLGVELEDLPLRIDLDLEAGGVVLHSSAIALSTRAAEIRGLWLSIRAGVALGLE